MKLWKEYCGLQWLYFLKDSIVFWLIKMRRKSGKGLWSFLAVERTGACPRAVWTRRLKALP